MKVIIPEKAYGRPIEDVLVFCDCGHAIYRFTLYADTQENKRKKIKKLVVYTMVEVFTQSMDDMNYGEDDDTPGIDISLVDMDRILEFLKKDGPFDGYVEVVMDCLCENSSWGRGLRICRKPIMGSEETLSFGFFPWRTYGEIPKIEKEYCDIIVEEPQKTEFIKQFELMCERAHGIAEQYKELGWEVVNSW